MVALPLPSTTTVRAGQLNEAARWRTPCGQSVNAASGRGDKPGTTRLRRVAPGLSPLIHPLPTLRRAIPATGCERLRRNNSKLFLFFYDKKDGTRMPLELHERQQRLNPPRSDGIPTTVVHQTRWRLPALFTNKVRKLAAIDTCHCRH